jgi:hypothetical protein
MATFIGDVASRNYDALDRDDKAAPGAVQITHTIPHDFRLPLECPFRSLHSDEYVLEAILRWFRERLPCVVGRREFNRGRYMIEIARAATVPAIFDAFVSAVQSYENTACLFIFNEPEFYVGNADAHSAFQYLAGQMAQLGDSAPDELANGEALSNTITLTCPVIGIETGFDDFECIAFCPQSADINDPLYDPLMYAPYTCVNLSSDVFAFSYFVLESSLKKFGKAPHEIADVKILAPFFSLCIERWHKIASSTIGNFAAITDTSRCPVHVVSSGDHWVAAHRDPAFAESAKVPHLHELPIIYASRICDAWIDHFAGGKSYCESDQTIEDRRKTSTPGKRRFQ